MSTTEERKTLMGRSLAPSTHVERILEERPTPPPQQPGFEREVRAVLFSDIVGSTAFFEQRGDEAGLAMVERHNRVLFPVVERFAGTIIKTIGDAIMASFPSAVSAVQSAVTMQRALREHNVSQAQADRIAVRIGINFGTVLCRERDLFGDVVNAAARVEALGKGDMILISQAVRDALGPAPEFPCSSFDAVRVKGKQEPLEVFEILWDPDAPITQRGRARLPEAGRMFGERFEIQSPLGSGGMGQVFRAHDRALDEPVALKFIHEKLARDTEVLSRFKREVKLARAVTHRNICRIHEFLEMEGLVFLSMELIEGISLTQLIRERAPLSGERAVEIAVGICRGLAEAHERGITHRDLKPGNVMIEEGSNRVVIMDFGIAELTNERRAEDGGMVVGTPEYMSPEQARGEGAGPASDIYALGAILYQMLTGRPPHTGDTAVAILIKQLNDQPVPPSGINPSIPAALEGLILRCLQKDPAARFANARDLLRALTGENAAPRRGIARRTFAWLSLAGLLLAAGLLAGLLTFWRAPQRPSFAKAQLRPLVSSPEVESGARWSPDGQRFAFVRSGSLWTGTYPQGKLTRVAQGGTGEEPEAFDLFWSADARELFFPAESGATVQLFRVPAASGDAVPLLPGVLGADLSPDGKLLAASIKNDLGGIDIVLSLLDGSGRRQILGSDTSVSYGRPRWSPDGRRLALVLHFTGYDTTRDIGVYELETGTLTQLTDDGRTKRACNTDPTWSPNGEWILYASRRTGTSALWVIPASGGESSPVTQGATEDQRSPSVSADGKAILFNTQSSGLDISLLDVQTGSVSPLTQDPWPDRFPVFSPDGRQVAFRSQRKPEEPGQQVLVVHDLEDNGEEELKAPSGMRDFAFCGPGHIAYSSTVGEKRFLGLLNLASNHDRKLVEGFHRIWSVAPDPSCSRVVFCGLKEKSDNRRLWMIEVASGAVRQLTSETGRETEPAYSEDGAWIAYRWAASGKTLGDAELRVVPTGGGKSSSVTKHPSFRRSRRRIRWSADGRSLFYMEAATAGGSLWQVQPGSAPKPITGLKNIHTFDFDVSPDGRSLVYPRALRSGDLFVMENVRW